MPSSYLAPTLQNQGYTGASGTTPDKPKSFDNEVLQVKNTK